MTTGPDGVAGQNRIYIICPVRDGTPIEVEQYVIDLEGHGWLVHFPPRDVQQDDPTGINICETHRLALENCDEVHVFWDVNSKGSHFDLGMAFALRKKMKLIKFYEPDNEGKSYLKVIKTLENK